MALYLLALVSLITAVNATHILGIFPLLAKSHFSCNHAILKSLHTAGHNVTMITPFPPERKIENFTYVAPPPFGQSFIDQSIDLWTEMSNRYLLQQASDWGVAYCENILKMPEIQDALRSSEKLYDVLFAEYLFDFDCYVLIAQKLNIPIIATVTLHTMKEADHSIGVPNNPAVIPSDFGGISSVEMNLFERMKNSWLYFQVNYYAKYTRSRIQEIQREYSFFSGELSIRKRHVSLIFYNNHASILPRVYVPNAIDVGGIHITPAKPLPKDIQKFIDEALHGVILFTFGSTTKSSSMPVKLRAAFLNAFASIPQRVIWKYEEPIENLPENVMISSWLPQRDILEHRNVIAFMTHCGQSGVYEAIITGTPVVTIPLFVDQIPNAALLQYHGVGVSLDFKTVTKESILAALNAVVNDTSYYERMQVFSRVFKDRPMTPQESVVYWTEYVIRHNGASHLRAIGTDMPFYKYFMLDIIAMVLLVMSLVIFVIYVTVRKIYYLITKKSKYLSGVKKND